MLGKSLHVYQIKGMFSPVYYLSFSLQLPLGRFPYLDQRPLSPVYGFEQILNPQDSDLILIKDWGAAFQQ